MSHIKITNLTKKFDTGTGPLTVVDDISFEVKDGEFVCLLGPSGSGKSVTLNCIAGLPRKHRTTVIYSSSHA
jgi:ABC-type sugar transport system ATPase subunit